MIWIEYLGFGTGLICVVLNTKQKMLAWPFALASVICYGFVFFEAKLFGDAFLQLFFLLNIVYGWWHWHHQIKHKQSFMPQQLSISGKLYTFFGLLICFWGIYTYLKKFTTSDVPFLDAITTSLSMVAQLLLNTKKIENWVLWCIADVIYVGLYLYKGLYPTALLYFIFTIIAVYGFLEWNKQKSIV